MFLTISIIDTYWFNILPSISKVGNVTPPFSRNCITFTLNQSCVFRFVFVCFFFISVFRNCLSIFLWLYDRQAFLWSFKFTDMINKWAKRQEDIFKYFCHKLVTYNNLRNVWCMIRKLEFLQRFLCVFCL